LLREGTVMKSITLSQANIIAAAALERARTLKFEPLTIAVLDPGGHLVALQREDGSGILRVEIATGKAFGSRELFERSKTSPVFLTAVMAASGGRMVPVPSGVLIRDSGGALLGAVGISGDTSDNDEMCAVAGIEAAGLRAQVGKVAT
jgi:uncharacterized protein GlcG (DUF336 family)